MTVEQLPALPDAFGPLPAAIADEAALRAWLRERVAAMLAADRHRLLALLYRVDVRERDLADALIVRMVEKQRFRNQHPP